MRCPECATDNPQDYRFCGMCGTPLGKGEPVSAAAVRAAVGRSSEAPERSSPASTSLSGPSFLGLGADGANYGSNRSSRDLDYLFEEEKPKRTYWRFALLVLILAVIGGLGWLEYTRNGKAWVAPWSSETAKAPTQTTQTPAPAVASPNPVAPASAQTTAEPPPAAAPGTPAATPAAGPVEKDIPPPDAASSAPTSTTAKPSESADKQESAPETSSEAGAKDESAAGADAAQKDTEDSTPAETKPAKFAATPKPKPAPPKPVVSEDDALVANAEKYLYGRGVPENCDRALSSLRAAAQRQNSRARSLLGSMYATGHCVPRDLPNAYRWFALASRDNTDNMWVQRNLEMIWREMTPQERQLAIQRNQ